MRVLLSSVVMLFMLAPLVPEAHAAQAPSIEVEDLECVPIGEHAIVNARVTNEVGGNQIRIYFRRLHKEVEDFYYVEMLAAGGGQYWTALPKPADEELDRIDLKQRQRMMRGREDEESENLWAQWWKAKEASDHRDPNDDLDDNVIRERASRGKLEARHWMAGLNARELQEWLSRQENEAAEYFGAVFDGYGNLLAKSEVKVVPVRNKGQCRVAMTVVQRGLSRNLTIGETSIWQKGEEVFHWLCDHVVTRIDPADVRRADETCRACVIAWWKKKGFLIPAAGVVTGITGISILDDGPTNQPVSPSAPGG